MTTSGAPAMKKYTREKVFTGWVVLSDKEVLDIVQLLNTAERLGSNPLYIEDCRTYRQALSRRSGQASREEKGR